MCSHIKGEEEELLSLQAAATKGREEREKNQYL